MYRDSLPTLQKWCARMPDRNSWGVSFSTISFLERALSNHKRVRSFERSDDIFFTLDRGDLTPVRALLVDEYTLGLAALMKARNEFPEFDCIVTGGNWNAYTREAKEFGEQSGIGVFIITEFLGALWRDNVQEYVEKDEDGDPVYHYR